MDAPSGSGVRGDGTGRVSTGAQVCIDIQKCGREKNPNPESGGNLEVESCGESGTVLYSMSIEWRADGTVDETSGGWMHRGKERCFGKRSCVLYIVTDN